MASNGKTPAAGGDRYVHTVGWWQGVLDDVGRLLPSFVDHVAPEAPVALCGVSLLVDRPASGDQAGPCPACRRAQKRRRP